MKKKILWILSVLLLLMILGETGMLFRKIARQSRQQDINATTTAQGIQTDTGALSEPEHTDADMQKEVQSEGESATESAAQRQTQEEMPQETEKPQETENRQQETAQSQMAQLLREKIRSYDGIWSVALKTEGMKTQENCDVYSVSHGRKMKSASLIKLFVMEKIYEQIGQSRLQQEQAESLVKPMITVSDNTACNTLVTDFLGGGDSAEGMAQVTKYAQQQGYCDTSMGRLMLSYQTDGDNYTSARDCVSLLEKIYHGTCVSAEASEKMLSFLQSQERRNKIPSGLQTRLNGEQEWVANKTGEIAQAEVPEKGMVEGDAAIVHTSFGDYIVCILVNDMESNAQTQADIQELSAWIYDYLAAENT